MQAVLHRMLRAPCIIIVSPDKDLKILRLLVIPIYLQHRSYLQILNRENRQLIKCLFYKNMVVRDRIELSTRDFQSTALPTELSHLIYMEMDLNLTAK